ncbi:MAG TPA: hypothetical protein VMT82_02080 [candidate division Zixibacteria bacterium]|nr:hypothetical protein [candidate division Zixibacteria bacterium]
MPILGYRLVRLIEAHAEGLAKALGEQIANSDRCPAYRTNVDPRELEQLVGEVYQHLGQWLLSRTENDIEQRYRAIGARRAQEGVPLSQVMWCIALVKENLWEYFSANDLLQQPAEVFSEMKMFQLLDQFIDRAIYYAAVGYENTVALGGGVHKQSSYDGTD